MLDTSLMQGVGYGERLLKVLMTIVCFATCGFVCTSCATDQPSISSCSQGAFFADCGGEDSPRLGCSASDCRWFVGGRVAEGYTASLCSADDICCQGGDAFGGNRGGDYLYFWGRQAWDGDRDMVLSVTQADNLAEQALRCDPLFPPQQPGCPNSAGASATALVRDATTSTFLRRAGSASVGWAPVIEIDPKNRVARLCTGSFTDTRAQCPLNDYSACASSGSVRVSYDLAQPPPTSGFLIEYDVEIGGHNLQGTVRVDEFQQASYRP